MDDMGVNVDVKGHGNDSLPGFETKLLPDTLTLAQERFQ